LVNGDTHGLRRLSQRARFVRGIGRTKDPHYILTLIEKGLKDLLAESRLTDKDNAHVYVTSLTVESWKVEG
jgi:hypothetical protein